MHTHPHMQLPALPTPKVANIMEKTPFFGELFTILNTKRKRVTLSQSLWALFWCGWAIERSMLSSVHSLIQSEWFTAMHFFPGKFNYPLLNGRAILACMQKCPQHFWIPFPPPPPPPTWNRTAEKDKWRLQALANREHQLFESPQLACSQASCANTWSRRSE